MDFDASNNSSDTVSFYVDPVPAYETNSTPSPDTQLAAETQPTAPAVAPGVDDITVYGAVTVQQHSSTTPNNNDQNSTVVSENKYTLQPVSPFASSAPQPLHQLPQQQQQMQQLLPQQQQLLQLTPQQQQLLQLTPQQQQMLQLTPQQQQQMPQLTPQQQQMQQFTPQQQQMQQLPLQQPQQHQQQQQQQQRYHTAVRLANLQEAGAPVDCPVCGVRAVTIVEMVSGNTTHLWAALVCIFTGFGCIPYLMHGLKDAQHKCGHCGVLLAQWHKSGRTAVFQHA